MKLNPEREETEISHQEISPPKYSRRTLLRLMGKFLLGATLGSSLPFLLPEQKSVLGDGEAIDINFLSQPITPRECPNLRFRGVGTPEIRLDKVRLMGVVVVSPSHPVALGIAQNSTFYHDGLRDRLQRATSFFNRHIPTQFTIEIVPGPILLPPLARSYYNLSEFKEANDHFPVRYYQDLDDEYPIYAMMPVLDPHLPIPTNPFNIGGGGGGEVWRVRGQWAGTANFIWQVIKPTYTIALVEHELAHALSLGTGYPNAPNEGHNPYNPRSVLYKFGILDINQVIIDRGDVWGGGGMCYSLFKTYLPISMRNP